MNWDGIDRIVENGILTKAGNVIPLDIIILSTGYKEVRLPVISYISICAHMKTTGCIALTRIHGR
jgi:cation diffusion facilitator CzcD-associated flavoprotein CzcO